MGMGTRGAPGAPRRAGTQGRRACALALAAAALLLGGASGCEPVAVPLAEAPECPVMPGDTFWHADVRGLPVHPRSDAWVSSIGADEPVHPDFGSGTWNGGPIGIPYSLAAASTPLAGIDFRYADESDPGPYPIPPDAAVEGGPDADGDRHVLVVDRDACVVYELFDAHPRPDGGWDAGSGAVFDLYGRILRPAGWTSADAAGLAILPALVRHAEVAAGRVGHVLRFTAPHTRRAYLWPARHFASASTDPDLPPMGAWFRLGAHVDPEGFSPQVRPIVEALQRHGMILADNGSPWFLSGAPDPAWDDDVLRELRGLRGRDFEAVDTAALQVDPDSARVSPQYLP